VEDGSHVVVLSGGHDDVLMSELAQNVTFESQMASNPATPFGIEFRDVEDLHRSTAQAGTQRAEGPRSAFSRSSIAANEVSESPFAALSERHGRPLRVGILSDFTRIPYANGAAFQTRFLYQELRRCGHEVTVIGPHDPDARPEDLAPGTVGLPSVPLKTYPGLHLPLPLERWVYDPTRWNFDIMFAQATTLSLHFGVWLRKMRGIPLICVNTTHLSAAYDVLLPESMKRLGWVNTGLELALKRPCESHFASIYNNSDGLVVLSEGLRSYWRERGVTCPIHVIPRAVQPAIFDRPLGEDPYAHLAGAGDAAWRGARLLCAGRHTREKSQDRIIRIFARHIAPVDREATLTMLGEGPDSEYYKRVAREEGVAHRVFFPGEVPFTEMPDWYAYADLFVHASLSETYGNVMGEALWCGTPTIAFADGMGVSSQIRGGVNGVLLSPGKGQREEREADAAFGRSVIDLLSDPQERARLGKSASKLARERNSPLAVQSRIADAFRHAQEHAAACRIGAAADGPRVLQWMTTFEHFKSWATLNTGLYLVGHLRPAADHSKTKAALHPQIAT
jgi:1,2-diacylglycerol 3-alpha-glucosyltransferase